MTGKEQDRGQRDFEALGGLTKEIELCFVGIQGVAEVFMSRGVMWSYFFFAKYPSDGHVENRWEKGQHGRKRKRLGRRPPWSAW